MDCFELSGSLSLNLDHQSQYHSICACAIHIHVGLCVHCGGATEPAQRVCTHLSLTWYGGMEYCVGTTACYSQLALMVNGIAVSVHRLSLCLKDDRHLCSLGYFASLYKLAHNACFL